MTRVFVAVVFASILATAGRAWAVDADGDGYDSAMDCNDDNPAVNPGAAEVCDPSFEDEDCDGAADDSDPQGAIGKIPFYGDGDGDGYGAGVPMLRCHPDIIFRVTQDGDCNSVDPTINPGAEEICHDMVDNDCNGVVDCADAPAVSGLGLLVLAAGLVAAGRRRLSSRATT